MCLHGTQNALVPQCLPFYSQKSFLVTSVAAESFRTESITALRTAGGNSGSDAILLRSGSVLMASANYMGHSHASGNAMRPSHATSSHLMNLILHFVQHVLLRCYLPCKSSNRFRHSIKLEGGRGLRKKRVTLHLCTDRLTLPTSLISVLALVAADAMPLTCEHQHQHQHQGQPRRYSCSMRSLLMRHTIVAALQA